MRHPAFQTGVVHVEPDLRDEMQRHWEEYAAWEETRQGPPPEVPSVSVRVDHEGKPSEAAGLRNAVAKKGAAAKGGGGIVAIAFRGEPVKQEGTTTLTPGTPGAGAPNGSNNVASNGGADGVTAAERELP
ncbi:hypothetical protein WME91_15790 [Sorangium sp. So ce269]